MGAATRPRPDLPLLNRFDRVERWVHGVNAALFLVLLATGAALYFAPLMAIIGRRHLVEEIHVYAGVALPVPVIAALAGSWGRGLRADIHRWNRWQDHDRRWLRAALAGRDRREEQWAGLRNGKFNAGQKLNATFTAGVILVMLATGIVMRWYHPYPLAWRTGATWVHDWLAFSAAIVIVGHICFALSDRDSLRSIRHGTISRAWAERHAPAWLDEMAAGTDSPAALAPGDLAPGALAPGALAPGASVPGALVPGVSPPANGRPVA